MSFSRYAIPVERDFALVDVCDADFYPDTIWPEGLRGIFHLNPMYQLIDFLRQIVIAGIPPTPERLLACGAGAFGMLMIGLVIFRRYEEKFVFHL